MLEGCTLYNTLDPARGDYRLRALFGYPYHFIAYEYLPLEGRYLHDQYPLTAALMHTETDNIVGGTW